MFSEQRSPMTTYLHQLSMSMLRDHASLNAAQKKTPGRPRTAHPTPAGAAVQTKRKTPGRPSKASTNGSAATAEENGHATPMQDGPSRQSMWESPSSTQVPEAVTFSAVKSKQHLGRITDGT